MLCPNCGSENSNERRFCFKCGRAFVSVRGETAEVESLAPRVPERNAFVDSLSGRNEFLDSLSGYRIDGTKDSVETIFVPSTEDDRTARGEIETADRVFEDEEADDVFEQSLSGLKIGEAETEEVATSDTSVAEIGVPVGSGDQVSPVPPDEVHAYELAENAPYIREIDTGRPVHVVESRKGTTWGRTFGRVCMILLYGAASFAIGSALTMQAFDIPQEIPSITDPQLMALTAGFNAPPKGMVFAPGGEFTMGSDDGDAFSRPAHLVEVGPYFIDLTEVTNEAYFDFVKATRHEPPRGWIEGRFPEGKGKFPVTGVTWYDATEYAAWSGKRLPTEAEWEFAARGSDGRVYPWGNEWDPTAANAARTAEGIREVGKGAKSPLGLFDMAGNVWEWTSSPAKSFPNGKSIPWSRLRLRIIRGGNWQSDSKSATAFFRGFYGAEGEKEYDSTGFRCVKDLPKN
jgi:formylglycine-generating enzyme required for sulfatase activity